MTFRRQVLHVVGDSKFGGGASVVVHIAEATERDGWTNTVLTTDRTFQQLLTERGLAFASIEGIGREIRPHTDFLGLIRLVRYLKQERFTLLHTHTSKGGVIGRLAGRLAGVPLIVHTVHGFAFHDFSRPLALRTYAGVERLAANWCDRIVTVSEFHREWALQLGIGDPRKTIAIPNGIALEELHPGRPRAATRADLGTDDNSLLILGVGRLAEQKGFADLIDAVSLLSKGTTPNFRLVIAGDGELRRDLEERIISRGLGGRAEVLGFRRDLADLYNAADLVVLPSLWEGLSIALLEAMAARTPIVTTSIPSNIEVTRNGEAAHLVPPAEPQQLADAILELAKSPDRRQQLCKRGAEIVGRYYRRENMAGAYVDLYAELAQHPRS